MLPINEFRTEEELKKCCKEWQNILFLNEWIIHPSLSIPKEFVTRDAMGECILDAVNKAARIRILKKKFYGDRILKYCAEKILVHELLHCKYNILGKCDTYEGAQLDMYEHGLLEEMAKSLIIAKYGVGLEYFDSEDITAR